MSSLLFVVDFVAEMIKCKTDGGFDVTDCDCDRPETNVKCDGNVKGNMDARDKALEAVSGSQTL